MKKIILLIVILTVSFSVYSQNQYQTTSKSLNEKLNDLKLNQKSNKFNSESFERKVIVNQEDSYRLDSFSTIDFNSDGISSKSESSYDENGNQTLYISYSWDTESQSLIPSNKYESSYDENGNLTLQIDYGWDTESQSFVPRFKYELSYDENGNQTLYISYSWDTESQSLIPSNKYEYSYDENGIRTLIIFYQWDTESQSLVPREKLEYSYDENGNLTLLVDYGWDTESQSFVLGNKDEFTYDENGNQTQMISYQWDTESQSFVYNYKQEYSYDENGNQLYNLHSNWKPELDIFTPSSITNFEYDEQKRLTTENEYSIDICSENKVLVQKNGYFYIEGSDSRGFISYSVTNDGDVVFNYKVGSFYDENGKIIKRIQDVNLEIYDESLKYYRDYSYDDNGNMNQLSFYKWDSTVQDYIPDYKWEYTYDENRNRTLFEIFVWDKNTESFIPSDKYEYSYDENNFKTNETSYTWNTSLGVYKPSFKMDISTYSETDTKLVREGIMYEYDTNFNTWNELEGEEFKSYWYYTKSSSLSTNSVEQKSFSIYPNPTTGFLEINSLELFTKPTIELYDLKGSRILSKLFKNDENIDISELKPSIYLYKIIDGNEVKQSGKLIKE